MRLRPLGCTPGESLEVLQLVRRSAAKRFSDWRDDLNHVVVSWAWWAGEAAGSWQRGGGRYAWMTMSALLVSVHGCFLAHTPIACPVLAITTTTCWPACRWGPT